MKGTCGIKNSEEIKVSIIIPVYNGENYIWDCIRSIINQSYKNIEIIVINDGSTDNTAKVLGKCDDERIKIITTENNGVSAARNKGLDMVTGKFVCFVDADDSLQENAIEKLLYIALTEKCDIVVSGITQAKDSSDLSNVRMVGVEFFNEMLYEQLFFAVCWGKLICTKLIKNLRFDCSYKIGEDLEWFSRLCYEDIAIYFTSDIVYNHRDNKNSVTKPFYNSNWEKEVILCEKLIHNNYGDTKKAAIARYVRINASCISYALNSNDFEKIKSLRQNIKKYFLKYLLISRIKFKNKLVVIAKVLLPICLLKKMR